MAFQTSFAAADRIARGRHFVLLTLSLCLAAITALGSAQPPARPAPKPASATAPPAEPAAVEPVAVDVTPSLEAALRHLGQDGPDAEIATWIDERDPEVMHVAVRLDEPAELTGSAGGEMLTMTPLDNAAGEHLFTAALRQPALQRATMSVYVSARGPDGRPTLLGPTNGAGIPMSPTFRGPDAPPAPAEVRELQGVVRTYTVPSAALGEERTVTVYLPPGYDPARPLPREYKGAKPAVVYFGDGGVVAGMAHFIEPMIVAQQMRHTVLVGVHTSDQVVRPPNLPASRPTGGEASANPFADDPRAMEYLEPRAALRKTDPDTAAVHEFMFDRHFTFFADELPKWAAAELGVDEDPTNRVITGFSNSAAFVMTLARRRPKQYGGVIANSMAGGRPPTDADDLAGTQAFQGLPAGAQPPRFLLASGTWETHFRRATDQWADYLRRHGADARRTTIVGGHDQAIWELALAEGLPWLLPPRVATRVTGGR